MWCGRRGRTRSCRRPSDTAATPPAPRHEISAFPGPGREDGAVGIANAEELRDPFTRLVVALGRPHGKRVRAAMRVCVRRLIEITQRIEHDPRLLRCRRRIEVVE